MKQVEEEKEFIFNEKRATEILPKLISAYDRREKIFNNKNELFPETRVDGMSDYEYKQFLFFSCILNHSFGAATFFKALKDHINKDRIKFDVDGILNDESRLRLFLDNHVRYDKESLSRLISCAEKLKREYNGDPANLFNDNLKEVYKKIDDFKGYGTKTSRMLVIWFYKHGLFDWDESELELAVDLHTMRMSVNLGIVGNGDNKIIYKEDWVDPLTAAYSDVCKKNSYSGLKLDEAFWAIGSKVCYRAIMRENDSTCKINCPVESDCRKRIYTNKIYRENRTDSKFLEYRGDLIRTEQLVIGV